MMTVATTDELVYDPNDRDTIMNPHPLFRRIREEAPLYHRDDQDFWAVSRFDDVKEVLLDRETYPSYRGVTLEILRSGMEFPGTLIFEDPPSHTIHRALLSRMFTNRQVSKLEPEIRSLCVDLMDPLVGSTQFDIVAEVASIVPMRVIGMLLGIPADEQVRLRDRSLDARDNADVTVEHSLSGELFAEFIDSRIKNPSDDIMTHLLNAEFQNERGEMTRLSREELLAYVNIVNAAGNETTRVLIGWSVKLLADHPDQRRRLVEDPLLIPNAVDEVLRYEGNTLQNCRYVGRDVEMYGRTVPEGSFMVTLTPAANRDPRLFEDPDLFDVGRKMEHHLGFGFGAHYCLGQALARLESRIVLEELLRRFPNFDVELPEARFMYHTDNRGWASLPITIR
jgi:cytochrome P450